VKYARPQKTNTIRMQLYEVPRVVKIYRQEVALWLHGLRGEGNGELLLNGYGVSVLEDEKCVGDGWW
jgi:hypothetical protein